MSSQLLNPNHFNLVEKQLLSFKDKDSNFIYELSVSQIKETMKQIRLISIESITYQYPSEFTDKSILIKEYLKPIDNWISKLSLVGLYKALVSIDYQIEVNQIKKHRELSKEEIKALELYEKITNQVAYYYISRLEEYEKSYWSLTY